jgi:RNA polymerase sigma factor (sigma-70 family)
MTITLGSNTGYGATAPATQNGFGTKYEEYFPRLFAYVYARVGNAHLAEDLVADVFERAFTKADSLRSDAAFSTWLFTIARNVIISHVRRSSRETIVDPEVMREIAPARDSVETEVVMQEELREIAQMVRTLPQREQDIISLKFDAELPNPQIAEIMGLSEPNVRVIIFRSLRKLRELIAADRARYPTPLETS